MSRNDESTKTRIETQILEPCQVKHLSRNDESTKTRIETEFDWETTPYTDLVVMTNPLKQGLKLDIQTSPHTRTHVVMTNPLKQGLKLDVFDPVGLCGQSRNDESTKTRIETHALLGNQVLFIVVMTNPLKQGLKPLVTHGYNKKKAMS